MQFSLAEVFGWLTGFAALWAVWPWPPVVAESRVLIMVNALLVVAVPLVIAVELKRADWPTSLRSAMLSTSGIVMVYVAAEGWNHFGIGELVFVLIETFIVGLLMGTCIWLTFFIPAKLSEIVLRRLPIG